MLFPNDTETSELTDTGDNQQLILDGTVHIDDSDEISIPRVKGMVELLNDFLRD